MARKNHIISLLRHKVTFEKETITRGASGENIKTWSTYAVRKAAITPLTGREYFQAQQEQNEDTIRFSLRYDSLIINVNPREYRITFNSRTYDIESIVNVMERNKKIEMMCRLHNGG